jgi:hypothetical protein
MRGGVLVGCFLRLATSACAAHRSPTRFSPPTPPFDRERETARVFAAVLREYGAGNPALRIVVDPGVVPPADRTDVPEDLGAGPDTKADWRARRATRPAPLDLGVPVTWFDDEEWDALLEGVWLEGMEELRARWEAFHLRHPRSRGWMRFGGAGFSADGDEAVVWFERSEGPMNGAGGWFLLRRRGGAWDVVSERAGWTS